MFPGSPSLPSVRRVVYLALLTLFSHIHTHIVFEIVSAYGTVGLSLGIPSVESPSLVLPYQVQAD